MPDDFDPYFKWLGIPPEEQPPNYYRLLGIPLYVDDPDVIETAADQRMMILRSYQTGKRASYSQRILNEVSEAKVCLLNPERKAAYDAELRAQLEPPSPVPEEEAAANPAPARPRAEHTPSVPTITTKERGAASRVRSRKKNDKSVWVFGGIAVVFVVGLVALIATPPPQQPPPPPPPSTPPIVEKPENVVSNAPSDAVKYRDHAYKVFTTPLPWRLAQNRCEEMGGCLVRIESEEENQFLMRLFQKQEAEAFWIDGSDKDTEGRWLLSDGSRMEYTSWDTRQPDNGHKSEHFVMFFAKSGMWWDFFSDSRRPYVCEWGYPPAQSSPVPTSSVSRAMPDNTKRFNGKHYLVFATKLPRYSAEQDCQRRGGHLARIESREESRFLSALLNESGLRDAWIDGSDETKEGIWRYSNGERLSFTNWSSGEPNNGFGCEHSILLRNDGRWIDFFSDLRAAYICEWEAED